MTTYIDSKAVSNYKNNKMKIGKKYREWTNGKTVLQNRCSVTMKKKVKRRKIK